jgi:hypothetical protein
MSIDLYFRSFLLLLFLLLLLSYRLQEVGRLLHIRG